MMYNYLEISKEQLDRLDYKIIKNHQSTEFINIESGFDIETSSEYVEGEKQAFMYVWVFGIGDLIYYGRTWEEFIHLMNFITEYFNLTIERRLKIYVHNLGYEFQFMRKWFAFESVFAVDERKPIKARTVSGLEFTDSLILSGSSLEFTAKNLNNHTVEKMVGDLDYSKTRTSETEITNKEWGYIKNDVIIILYYIREQMEQYGDITKIPLTNTSRVRNFVRDRVYYTNKNHKKTNKGKYSRYCKLMNNLKLSTEDYLQLKQAFMGGFTHANANYSGKLLENVSSIDFTSSYPSVMVTEKYPMSEPIPVEIDSVEELEKLMRTHAVLLDVKFTEIESKIKQENYISESKCTLLEKPILNNGRVYSADELAMTITDIDFQIMKQAYSWGGIAIKNVKKFHKDYLPKDMILSILDLYKDKTELKGIEGREQEYNISKAMLNSVYGMSVTDIVKDNHVYNDDLNDWELEPVDIDEEIEKHNNSKNRFLYYAWGVWVTAYARFNLWSGILAMGDDYVYTDTDSIKFKNMDKHKKYIEYYDEQLIARQKKMCDYYKISYEKLSPLTIEGTEKPIGVWDYEGTYSRFKTLGAKRYLEEENGKLALTLAGLSKLKGLEYMKDVCYNDNTEIFKMFDDSLFIPAEKSGKMTHTYLDSERVFDITDYTGNVSTVNTLSGIHLEPAEFTLSISKQYNNFITRFVNGFMFGGVTLE